MIALYCYVSEVALIPTRSLSVGSTSLRQDKVYAVQDIISNFSEHSVLKDTVGDTEVHESEPVAGQTLCEEQTVPETEDIENQN